MHVAIKSSQRSEWNCEQSKASNSFQIVEKEEEEEREVKTSQSTLLNID